MANYQEELNKFKQKWNLPEYDLGRLAGSVQQFRYVDAFLMNASVDNSPTGQYLQWFSRTLSIYFATNTTPSKDGKYISSFNAQEFYDSFKNLVQAKYDADAMEKNVKGLNVNEVTDGQKANIEKIVSNCKRKYQKTLPDMWQESLKEGALGMDKLKGITNEAYPKMMVHFGDKKEMDGYLTNMVAAHEAMKQLRASRSGVWGWLWKVIFNREQNRQEKAYLEELSTKLNDLKIRGYNVDDKIADLNGNTVFGKKLMVENTQEIQPKEKAKTQEKPAKTTSKSVKIKPCAKKIEENFYKDEFNDNIVDELLKKIPVAGADEYRRKVLSTMVLRPAFQKHINDLNKQFDQDIKSGNQNDAMAKLVRGVFKVANQYNSLTRSGSNVNNVNGCAIIAQTFINNLTAVSIYPQLEGVANEYIKNNVALYKEIVEQDYVYSEKIEGYAVDYAPSGNYTLEDLLKVDQSQKNVIGNEKDNDVSSVYDDDNDYEPAFDDNNPFIENEGEIVPPVSQAPKKDVPNLDLD